MDGSVLIRFMAVRSVQQLLFEMKDLTTLRVLGDSCNPRADQNFDGGTVPSTKTGAGQSKPSPQLELDTLGL
jgi:hypothetical protein